MSGTFILVILSLVTFVPGQSQVPPLQLKIARNNLYPNDSVLITWEIPSADVESFSVEWEAVVSGQGGEIPVALVPNKTDRYSVVLKPMTIGLEYNVEVTALLPPPLRLSEYKTFRFAPMALVDVAIFGITQRSMALNVTALEPLSAKDNIKVTIKSDGVLVPISNISVIGHVDRSRFLNVYLPNDIFVVPSKTYKVNAESIFLDSVSEWITPTSVPAAPISAIIKNITPSGMELDVRLANQIDYNLNFSFVVDVFDMNGKLYSVRNGVIRNTGGENNTARLYFDEQLPSGMDYFIRLKTEYNGVESYWFSDLQTVNLRPTQPEFLYVDRDLTSPDEPLFFRWSSGGGKSDRYDISIIGTDGLNINREYRPEPSDQGPYTIQLPPLTPEAKYSFSVQAFANDIQSIPAFRGFRYVDTDPTKVKLLQMTPYTVELGVTLLGNTTEKPELEASLRDGQDRNLFVVSNATTWRGTGRDRVVRVDMSDRPLRADRDYKVSVRTLHQGEWGPTLTTDNFITLNPLTPTVTSIQLAPDPDSLSTGASTSALVGVKPGESPVGSYLVEWMAVDGSERGNTTYIPTPWEIFLPVSIPMTGLTPGQQYSFRVTASQGDRNATVLDYLYTQDPAMPQSLLIEMDPSSPDGLILYWTPGTGKADFFNINVVGNDGQRTNMLYTPTPSDTAPYSATLPTLTRGGTYAFSVQAVVDNIQSVPALKGFRFVDTDPTEVELLQMTPYTVELGVTLLGNTTETPELEASLRDGQGRDLFVVSNATTWQGSGRDRVVRVDMSERPLKADRDYRVAVRTKHNGAFGEVMLADNTLTLDPLTPSVTSIRFAADPDGHITGVSTSALVGVQPGESPVGSYLVEWTAVDGSERGNTTYIPTPEEIFLPVSIPVTGLTPGQEYSFRVTASQGDRNATGLDYLYTQGPAEPKFLYVVRILTSPDESLFFRWSSGGGKSDRYDISIIGTDGLNINREYSPGPSDQGPYTIPLPPLTPGATYDFSVRAFANDIQSVPAFWGYRYGTVLSSSVG